MELREKLLGTTLIKEAMMSKDKLKLSVYKNIKADIERKEAGRKQMTEQEIISMIRGNCLSLKENISILESRGNLEEVEHSKKELDILESFVPKLKSEEETREIVLQLIDELKIESMRDMGKLMGYLNKNYSGTIDNSIASKIVKENL